MKHLAPYQIFFPIGLFNAIVAVGVWFTQNLNWFSSPALFVHGKLIVGGFLWSFITGFLMTAIPRMTGTANANQIEYILSLLIMLCLMAFSWSIDPRFFYAAQIALVFFLMIYGGRRVFKTTKPVPVFFSHVGIAMVLAVIGSAYHFSGNSFMGIHLYHIGTTLLLVLGIGTRFFSFLSGLPSDFENIAGKSWLFHGLGVSCGALLFLCGLGNNIAYFGLFLVSLVYLFFVWKIQRPADRPSALKYSVRLVAAAIPLSFLMVWMQPESFLAWIHVLFIGCFGLITFSVATRVTLAHGSYPTDMEMRSPALWWMLGSLAAAIVSRIGYGYTEGLWKTSCLHLAATLWIFAVGIWCWSFLFKIFKPGPLAKPSC